VHDPAVTHAAYAVTVTSVRSMQYGATVALARGVPSPRSPIVYVPPGMAAISAGHDGDAGAADGACASAVFRPAKRSAALPSTRVPRESRSHAIAREEQCWLERSSVDPKRP